MTNQNVKLDQEALKNFLKTCGPATKIYLGCDSEVIEMGKNAYADFCLAVVVHIDGCKGAKVFGEVHRERVFDAGSKNPALRLMTEVYKLAQLYADLKPIVERFDHELHLDINPEKGAGSNCVMQQAIGYITGVCQLTPMIKPRAFAASYAADRFKSLAA